MPGLLRASSRAGRAALLVAAALLAVGDVRPAAAQSAEPSERARPGRRDKKEALRRLAQGDKKLQRGDRLARRGRIEQAFAHFEEALAEYQAAHEAYPDPQIFFPIAQAEQRLGRFVDALQHYQELLAESKALSPALRSQVQIHLDEVRKNLAAVVLEVEPSGADILIDDKEVGTSPMSQPVFVEPGQHTFAVTREGYARVEGNLDLAPGKELRKRIRLEPVEADRDSRRQRRRAERVVRRPLDDDEEERARRPSALPLWIGIGVTGALAVGGAVTGFAALAEHGRYEDESRSMAAREAARRDGQKLAGVTDIFLAGAVVGAGVTAYYYFAIYRPRAAAADRADARGPEGAQSRLHFVPLVGDDMAGLAVSGGFW
jgi:tetratricopeptide (TPR) repeat protein